MTCDPQAALEGPSDCVDDSVGVYRTRRDAAVEVLQQYGMHKCTFSLWLPLIAVRSCLDAAFLCVQQHVVTTDTPEGAFYLLIDVEQDSQQFAHVGFLPPPL